MIRQNLFLLMVKKVKEYALWADMLRRCFSEKAQTHRPTYKGCNVSDNFLHYSFFYDWCHEQIGFGKVDDNGRNNPRQTR